VPARLVTAPTSEPVSLAEAKAHLRLETTADDTLVAALIVAARQWAEEYLWRGLVTQTWELVLDAFPERGEIELPRGNLVSIASLKYVDDNGTEQTWAASNYTKDDTSEPGKLRLAYDKDWPSARDQWDAVKIRYTVGWAGEAAQMPAEADRVPAAIRAAMMLVISQLYEHRTPEVVGTIVSKVSFAVEALLGPYRLARY